MNREKIKVEVQQRMFTLTLTETEVNFLIERLKFKETYSPDLTEPIWKSLESSLGYLVEEHADL